MEEENKKNERNKEEGERGGNWFVKRESQNRETRRYRDKEAVRKRTLK